MRDRAFGIELSDDEIQARVRSQSYGPTLEQNQSSTAIIPIYGPIIPRATLYSEVSGTASHDAISQAVRNAADNDEISEIILDISSPGGTVEGVSLAAEAVTYANSKKPVTAHTGGMLCSAAYWIAARAGRIVASPTAQVGSIGVVQAHVDMSELEADRHVKTKIFRSGERKMLGHPSESLTDLAISDMQREVDELFDVFITDVAEARGVTKARAKESWGDGAVYVAGRAVDLGLADDVGTLQEVLDNSLPKPGRKRSSGRKASAMEEELTLEEMEQQNPKLLAAIRNAARAEGLTAGRAEGHAAGVTEAQATASTQGTGDRALRDEVIRLTNQFNEQTEATRVERRKNIASSVLDAANLPKLGTAGDVDLDADFRAEIEEDALNAADDAQARQVVTAKVERMKLIAGNKAAEAEANARNTQRLPRRLVPEGDTSRTLPQQQGHKAETPNKAQVASIRSGLGLPR